jgi:hypothetical protein
MWASLVWINLESSRWASEKKVWPTVNRVSGNLPPNGEVGPIMGLGEPRT